MVIIFTSQLTHKRMEDFFQNYSSGIKLDAEIAKEIRINSQLITVKPGQLILSEWQKQENMFFLVEGVVRRYSIMDDKEFTNWFFSKGDFAISENSMLLGTNSEDYLETTCPSILIQIEKSKYLRLQEQSLQFKEIQVKLYQSYLKRRREHQYSMSSLSALDRYREFLKMNSYSYKRIKMQHLASFLGITEQSLSRIRATIKKQDRLL